MVSKLLNATDDKRVVQGPTRMVLKVCKHTSSGKGFGSHPPPFVLFVLPFPWRPRSELSLLGGVEYIFFITQVHKFSITIVSLDVANTLILVLNNYTQLTDVHIKFLN